MAIPSQPLPTIGQPNASEDPKTRSVLSELQTILTSGVDGTNLTVALLQLLGLNAGSQLGRGKSIIAAAGTRTNVAYGSLSNGPDVVTSVVLPTDGLIVVAYNAIWQESVNAAARAAIFLGANQLKGPNAANVAPVVLETAIGTGSLNPTPLVSHSGAGMVAGGGAANYGGDVTTGQILGLNASVGGPCYIFANAGTYDVSVQFKASSGTVTVSSRHLWVWTIGF